MKLEEIKNLLKTIGFSQTTKQVYEKKWSHHNDYEISIDFGKQQINYPKPIELGDATTSNLSHDENMVVLECVSRLLDKGYKPESLTLEKRWPTGRGSSGGKSDINITSLDGRLLLIVECKTWGSEYEKEQSKMVKNGGQLFSYLQHDHNTQFLCLYASRLDVTKVQYENAIVRIKDDQKLVEQFEEGDAEIRLYREAKNKEDFYQAWFENTSCYFHPNGIFDDDAQPYNIELKPLKNKDLKSFKSGDGGFIHNQFAEILRHNNISDKENAFNKMISLFLCKVVDESKDINEIVDFQWKEGIDTYEDLQDRLQKLYHIGMKEYLKELIIYFENDYVDKAFRYHKKAVAKDKMTEMLKALKFYSNNEFAFKEVHNERLFAQNAKVVNEIVQLLQRYRFKYSNKQQFLGNLFELLLNDGVKQSEGQFFTPIPIARFIVSSMPIAENVAKNMKNSEVKILPRVIDYACGSGHFLTETIDEIQQAIEKQGINQYQGTTGWTRDCIYGVEKDYRLSRTAKIACFLNGAGDANILYEDGLEQHPDLGEKESFDILVANPPYSIKDFKQHLHLKNNDFELLNGLSDSASEIETLFVERITQLLKAGGMAGVILPSSILSNGGVYTRAREILLKTFFIRSIVELRSNTFIATNTNTVVLFLEKRGDDAAVHYQYRVESLFENPDGLTQEKQCIDFDDEYLLSAYCQIHQIAIEDYRSLLVKEPTQGLKEHEHFQSYKSWFDGLTETTKINKQTAFKNKPKSDQQAELNRRFWLRVHEREKERLLYFALAYSQNVVIVKAGEKQVEKEFLGYEWSKRRGHEGMKAIGDGKLVDINDYNNPQKANSYIRKNFLQQSIDSVDEAIADHVSQAELINMLEFDRFDFNKRIDLISYPEPSLEYTKYEIKRLNENLIDEVLDNKRKPVTKRDRKPGIHPYYGATGEVDKIDKYIFDEKLVLIGEDGAKWQAFENSAFIVDGKYWVNNHAHVIKPNRAKIIDEYLVAVLNVFDLRKYVTGWNNVPKLNQGNLLSIKIPLPPIPVQKKIVKEIQGIEKGGVTYSSIANAQHEIYIKKKVVLDKYLK